MSLSRRQVSPLTEKIKLRALACFVSQLGPSNLESSERRVRTRIIRSSSARLSMRRVEPDG